MRKRLEVRLDERELRAVQRAARRAGLSVGAWVREALREACSRGAADVGRKLAVARRAARYAFPTADIHGMLAEIDLGATASGESG
jgi:hypothetical protein